MQAMFGRNGESPLPVLAPQSPTDCFDIALEAWEIAARFMLPVMILSDGYIANGVEPWLIPDVKSLKKIPIEHPVADGQEFLPYSRDENLARPWALPGTPGLEHRLGGLEKQDGTGNVSYDPDNHQHMCKLRARKVANIADFIPEQAVVGEESGDLLVLSWGGTYGACLTAVRDAQRDGLSVSHAHLRYLNPFPRNLGDLLGRFKKVLVPELNLGQLRSLIRGEYLVDAVGLNKVMGKPFSVSEVLARIRQELE